MQMDYLCEKWEAKGYTHYEVTLKGANGSVILLEASARPNDPFFTMEAGKSYRLTVEEIPAPAAPEVIDP